MRSMDSKNPVPQKRRVLLWWSAGWCYYYFDSPDDATSQNKLFQKVHFSYFAGFFRVQI
jgi:hypothetical protein